MILTGCCLSLSWHRALIVIFSCFFFLRTHSSLTLNEMILYIIRGINLPAPSGTEGRSAPFKNNSSSHVSKLCSRPAPPPPPTGVSPHDLDANVKFEFPFPSAVRIISLCHTWTPNCSGKISAGLMSRMSSFTPAANIRKLSAHNRQHPRVGRLDAHRLLFSILV